MEVGLDPFKVPPSPLRARVSLLYFPLICAPHSIVGPTSSTSPSTSISSAPHSAPPHPHLPARRYIDNPSAIMGIAIQKPRDEPGAAWPAILVGLFAAFAGILYAKLMLVDYSLHDHTLTEMVAGMATIRAR